MLLMGNYPFIISVWNSFAPPKNPPGVQFKVTFNQNRCYFEENEDLKTEHALTVNTYLVTPGSTLAFPMHFGNESLTIELAQRGGIPNSSFRLSVGCKAKNIPNNELGTPIEDSFIKTGTDSKGEIYYVGGSWEITPDNKNWKLTIKKFGPDPQTDDVTVGPGTPG
ncbi:MAG TPA: hypothetical protein VK186_18525 [Candidatus Deferrimicrobium sp.]|nr:hypothetical protein [Candidatus Deferrimicrobium sp.]